MKFVTKEEYDQLLAKDRYWTGRWDYTKEVVKILEKENINSALEVGSKELQVVKGSDIMDNAGNPHEDSPVKYTWDAGCTPWPIEDKQYDTFIALQVWEHLRENQRSAFNEVMRCSKMAVLSFPFEWDCPNDPMHNAIDYTTIFHWTLGIHPVKVIPIINHRANKKDERNRIIYFFKF